LTGKCFPLTNFSNGKQTQESLKSDFLKINFQETNTAFVYDEIDILFQVKLEKPYTYPFMISEVFLNKNI
jgi:hypothetical protein